MRDDLDFLSQDIVKLEKEYGESSLTVEEVLKIPIFSRCKVIAGHEGLGGLCKHMTPLETPDGIEWLQGGEFLISAGYALRGSDHLLNKFVFKAYKRGVAAIAIKEKRYIQKITPEMIDQANKYKIPLIILPYDFIYTETVSKFYEALFYKKNQYILQAKNMHERLLNLVFDAKDVKGVIEVLSSLTNSSIVVYDSLFNLLGSSVYNSAHKDIMKNFIEQYGLPAYGINLENYLLEMKGGSHFISSYQIASSRKVEGYVYIISDTALNNLTKNAINHGCMILSLKLKTEEKKYVNEIKIKKAVTDILMDNKNIHEEFFCNIMNDFNWNDRKSFMGISININCNKGKEKIESSIMGFKDELYSLISRFFGEEGFLLRTKMTRFMSFIVLIGLTIVKF